MAGKTENGWKLLVTSSYLQSWVVFDCRPFPNSLKYRDHQCNLPTISKTRLLQTLIEELS